MIERRFYCYDCLPDNVPEALVVLHRQPARPCMLCRKTAIGVILIDSRMEGLLEGTPVAATSAKTGPFPGIEPGPEASDEPESVPDPDPAPPKRRFKAKKGGGK